MSPRIDLPEKLALFPLPGAVLLPRGRLPLHVFEPRYLALLDDTLKTAHRLIGMIQPCPGPGGENALHRIGCAGRVTAFSETDDGRYMITLAGVSRFRVLEEEDGFAPYRKACVSWSGFERDRGAEEADAALDRDAFLDLLARYLDAEGLKTDWESLKDAEDELLINSLSMLCPFEPEEKQALLEAPGLDTRRETLVTLMEYALYGGTTEEVIQ